MARNKSNRAWLHEHITDFYVRQAQAQGYRSRSAYKLMQLNERDQFLKPGMLVVDLGAAPGGWSQVASEVLAGRGRVFALDLLEMAPIGGVSILQGDFTDEAMLAQLVSKLDGAPVDLVLSDMAPNLSGIANVDQVRSIGLAELALDFAAQHLKPGGAMLVKLFQGEGFQEFVTAMRVTFAKVATRKPEASRSRSNEVYLLGTSKRAS